jgi:glutathione-regulated potassium-efflux system protein KefB
MVLIEKGVEFQIRETFESAMRFGEAALTAVGVPEQEAAEILAEVRQRDLERLELQIAGGMFAGAGLLKGNIPVPAPLTQPKRAGRAMNPEAVAVLASEGAEERVD